MKKGVFSTKDLRLLEWQYAIRHTDANCFACGEKVFLKSNPEISMIVVSVNKKNITTKWCNIYNVHITTKTPLLGMCCYKPFFFTNQK